MIASKISAIMRSALDAEGSGYYDDDLDIIPAINYGIRYVEGLINAALGQKKIGEEVFGEIAQARVFRASVDNRISFSDFPHTVWTITGVFPYPETGTTGASAPTMTNDKKSYLRPDLYHKNSQFAAKRLTIDEWTKNRNNPYEAGYDKEILCAELRQYAYLNPVTYNPDNSVTIAREMEVRPQVSKQLVTVFYLQKPNEIATLTDDVPFPESVLNLLANAALNFIAYKQGDQTTLASITEKEIVELANMLM